MNHPPSDFFFTSLRKGLYPRLHARWIGGILLLGAILLRAWGEPASGGPEDGDESQGPVITVRMVSDFDRMTPVHELERLEPIYAPPRRPIDPPIQIGTRATLWVRNASINHQFFFERFYQNRYISRSAERTIPLDALGPGEHHFQPGAHRFVIDEEGRITSDDPDIHIDGHTVSLRLHKINVLAVDGARAGPLHSRMIRAPLNVYQLPESLNISPNALPETSKAVNLARGDQEEAVQVPSAPVEALSEGGMFLPLSIWLPANTQGQGYAVYPSWQTFHLDRQGRVQLKADGATEVFGVDIANDQKDIVLSYQPYLMHAETQSRLTLGLGPADAGQLHERLVLKQTVPPDLDPETVTAFVAALVEKLKPIKHETPAVAHERTALTIELKFSVVGNDDPAATEQKLRQRVDEAETKIQTWIDENKHPLTEALGEAVPELTRHEGFEPRIRYRLGRGRSVMIAPDLEPLVFRAVHQHTTRNFCMPLGTATRDLPFKSFAADNTSGDPTAVRMIGLEYAEPIFIRGSKNRASLRFMPTPGKVEVTDPVVSLSWSPYRPTSPDDRAWQPVEVISWTNGLDRGELVFQAPDIDPQFMVLRATIRQRDKEGFSPLSVSCFAYVANPGQTGHAAFASDRGRDAFQRGESIDLNLMIRTPDARPQTTTELVLNGPDGPIAQIPLTDDGQALTTLAVGLPAEATQRLQPGTYTLTVKGLPESVAVTPFAFDLVNRTRKTPYQIHKPHFFYMYGGKKLKLRAFDEEANSYPDLQRAAATIAELGFTRVVTEEGWTTLRPWTWREALAGLDPRLPHPATVKAQPSFNLLLNECVRQGIELTDHLLPAGDHYTPRRIEGYTKAAGRMAVRSAAAMRHSPAFTGQMLYCEAYQTPVGSFIEGQPEQFNLIRQRLFEEIYGQTIREIDNDFARYLKRPASQRDPDALNRFLMKEIWLNNGWGDFTANVAAAVRPYVPGIAMGIYQRTWGPPGNMTGTYNGSYPNLLDGLDMMGNVHYTDNHGMWMQTPLMSHVIGAGSDKPVIVNMNLDHASAKMMGDGQHERMLAFAQLALGAKGISHSGLGTVYTEGANRLNAVQHEVTRHLNEQVLIPFGQTLAETPLDRAEIGIVNLQRMHLLGDYKVVTQGLKVDPLLIACWRLGYRFKLLQEPDFEQSLKDLKVIFVTGAEFDGELPETAMQRLAEARDAGTQIVVEKDSLFTFPGAEEWDDLLLIDMNLGKYFPTWHDDELEKLWKTSQHTTDVLARRLPALGVEPSAWGNFTVGPIWHDGGDIRYLVMANFDEEGYGHTIKAVTAGPRMTPLTVRRDHGEVAWDMLRRTSVPLREAGDDRVQFDMDMRKLQGGLMAFLPQPIEGLRINTRRLDGGTTVRVSAELQGADGEMIQGLFPARLQILNENGEVQEDLYRTLGQDREVDLDLAMGFTPTLVVEELISGRESRQPLPAAPDLAAEKLLRVPGHSGVAVQRPDEITRFLTQSVTATSTPVVAVSEEASPEFRKAAERLAEGLSREGRTASVMTLEQAGRSAGMGLATGRDPRNDGFHYWKDLVLVEPGLKVDRPMILVGPPDDPNLIRLARLHYLVAWSEQPARPIVSLAPRAYHPEIDTLCIVALDADGVDRAASELAKLAASGTETTPERESAVAGDPMFADSDKTTDQPAPISFLNSNEYALDLVVDDQGAVYVTTLGHGRNLFSFSADGALRFARRLPYYWPQNLEIHGDTILASTRAGAYTYHLNRSGQLLGRFRLPLDPGSVYMRNGYSLSNVGHQYTYLPDRRVILFSDGPEGREIDLEGNILRTWKGASYRDEDLVKYDLNRELHAMVMSPDGKTFAQIESTYYWTKSTSGDTKVYDLHLVIRDVETLEILHEALNVDNAMGYVPTKVVWYDNDPGPTVIAGDDYRLRYDQTATLMDARRVDNVYKQLPEGSYFFRDGRSLIFVEQEEVQFQTEPLPRMPVFFAQSTVSKSFALLDETGWCTIIDTETGRSTADFKLPEVGQALRFTPDGQGLLFASFRGLVACFNLDGTMRWSQRLDPLNPAPHEPEPLPEDVPDYTDRLWPSQVDLPGELEQKVRMGENRLQNPSFESPLSNEEEEAPAWTGESLTLASTGRTGRASLQLGQGAVSQTIENYLGRNATWVLEFYYRALNDESVNGDVLAGLRPDPATPSDTVTRTLKAGKEWKFARVATKSGLEPQTLTVGFQSEAAVLIDDVSLRQIRFPSVNHLFHEPLKKFDPVHMGNPMYEQTYYPIPSSVINEIPNPIFLRIIGSGARHLVEPSFFQNGRFSDFTNPWLVMPTGRDTPNYPLNAGFSEPQWISTVVLYFNAYDEENVTPHFDLYASDVDAGEERLVASVRRNQQVMSVLTFDPVRTDRLRLELINSHQRIRTLTEWEAYGPLSGHSGAPGFTDPEGQNTYMGGFDRVDRRTKRFSAVKAPLAWSTRFPVEYGNEEEWHVPMGQILAGDGRFYVTRAFGGNDSYALDQEGNVPWKDRQYRNVGGLGYTPHATYYGGLLFKQGLDGSLNAVDPRSGRALWSRILDDRPLPVPVAVREDLYAMNSRGELYRLDFASGSILGMTPIDGPTQGVGALTTDGTHLLMLSHDGHAWCIDLKDNSVKWKTPIAPWSEGTIAVDQGMAYFGDREGVARAVRVADGSLVWEQDLGQEFERCPVVLDDAVVFGCRGGKLAALERSSGAIRWSRDVRGRFHHEPMQVNDKLLYFDFNEAKLASLSDGTEEPLVHAHGTSERPLAMGNDPLVSLSWYNGNLFVVPRHHNNRYDKEQLNSPWHFNAGRFYVIRTEPPVEIPPVEEHPVEAAVDTNVVATATNVTTSVKQEHPVENTVDAGVVATPTNVTSTVKEESP